MLSESEEELVTTSIFSTAGPPCIESFLMTLSYLGLVQDITAGSFPDLSWP